jgi:hypothetical protein
MVSLKGSESMAVYVDNMQAQLGHMKMCHMIADSHQELLLMADRIGIERRWIQFEGTAKEHFDISLSKRALAVAAGAVELSMKDLARIVRARRQARCETAVE